MNMVLASPRIRKLLFVILNFPLTLILFAAFNSLANAVLRNEPSLQVLIGIYIFLTAVIDIFLLNYFGIKTLGMVLTVIMEVILIYALFMYLFLRSF